MPALVLLQVAYELLKAAGEQGLKTWKNAVLDGKPFKLTSALRSQVRRQALLPGTFTCGACAPAARVATRP